MGRSPCGSKDSQRRAWSVEEDFILVKYIKIYGEGAWDSVSVKTGLKRSGKSCRLRWLNYLRPDIKRGNISREEDDLIIKIYGRLGTRWSLIAKVLPGRTDNEIKNYWNATLSKRAAKSHNSHTSNFSSTSIEDNCISRGEPIETAALPSPETLISDACDNTITTISSSTSIEDSCISKGEPIVTTASTNLETLISDGCDSSVHIKEKEDHVDLNFCLNDDLHALIETAYLDEIGDFESLIQLRNSFESDVEEDQSFAVGMLDNHDQLELQCSLKSKLQSLRQILQLEDK